MIRGVIDLHAHILPGVDDGPPTLDGSAAMAKSAVATGTTVMAATSHVNRGFGLTPAQLDAGRAKVVERLRADGIPLEVVQGGEISPPRVPDMTEDDLHRLTLGGGGWLLLECPLSPAAATLEPLVAELQRRGFRVLLAHPERSPSFQREPALLARLVASGALGQVTTGAFAGEFGDAARKAAFAMLEVGLVHVLASDAHDHAHRPPDLRFGVKPLERRYGDVAELVDWMTVGAPAAVLAGDPLPERPELPQPRPGGGLLRRFRA
jgi:protein-tyrosine phosphatase